MMKPIQGMTKILSSALNQQTSPSKPNLSDRSATSSPAQIAKQGYIDGYAYRRLASRSEVATAIRGFSCHFLGREMESETLTRYLQQWDQGRALRSIRDEIANCREAQAYRWG